MTSLGGMKALAVVAALTSVAIAAPKVAWKYTPAPSESGMSQEILLGQTTDHGAVLLDRFEGVRLVRSGKAAWFVKGMFLPVAVGTKQVAAVDHDTVHLIGLATGADTKLALKNVTRIGAYDDGFVATVGEDKLVEIVGGKVKNLGKLEGKLHGADRLLQVSAYIVLADEMAFVMFDRAGHRVLEGFWAMAEPGALSISGDTFAFTSTRKIYAATFAKCAAQKSIETSNIESCASVSEAITEVSSRTPAHAVAGGSLVKASDDKGDVMSRGAFSWQAYPGRFSPDDEMAADNSFVYALMHDPQTEDVSLVAYDRERGVEAWKVGLGVEDRACPETHLAVREGVVVVQDHCNVLSVK